MANKTLQEPTGGAWAQGEGIRGEVNLSLEGLRGCWKDWLSQPPQPRGLVGFPRRFRFSRLGIFRFIDS